MRTIAFVLAMTLFPLVAFSQSTGDFQIYASGGASVPLSSNNCSRFYQVDTALSGVVLPSMEFSGTWTSGFHFGFGLGYAISPDLSVILDLNYNSANLNKTEFLKDLGLGGNRYVEDVTMKMVSINANVKYLIPQQGMFFDPYVTAGAGFMGIAANDIAVVASAYNIIGATFKTQSALNTALGVGIDIRSSESSSLFVEVKYDVSYTRSASPFSSDNFIIVPVRVGIRGTL